MFFNLLCNEAFHHLPFYSSFTGHGLINIFNRLALYLDLLPFWEDGMGQLYGSWFFTSISFSTPQSGLDLSYSFLGFELEAVFH